MSFALCRCIGILTAVAILGFDFVESAGGTCLAQGESALPFIHSSADIVVSTRPAMMMDSDDYLELKRKAGPILDGLINRQTDSYFKFALKETQQVDQIIHATALPADFNVGRQDQPYNVMVLKTTVDNTLGFDIVTRDVANTLEHKGEKYYRLKKRLGGYEYAYIANKTTIVWAASKNSIERSIEAGPEGPKAAKWFKPWSAFSKKHVSLALNVKPIVFGGFFPANLGALKAAKMFVAGAEVGKTTKAKAHIVCSNRADAVAAQKAIEQGLLMALQAMEMQKESLKRSGDELAYDLGKQLIDATRVETVANEVQIEASIKIDFDAILPMLTSAYAASLRNHSANNLRQIAISFHNYHDAHKKLPASVMVHESGKKYSWRIAILPYIGEKEMYDSYDFDQEWNSLHNREVTSRMPDFFRSDIDDKDSTNSSWFMLTGTEGISDGQGSMTLEELANADGTSATILAVEAKRNVHWAKPEDIQVNPGGRFPKLGGFHKGGFNAAMGDASVRFVNENADAKLLWGLFTASGNEKGTFKAFEFND